MQADGTSSQLDSRHFAKSDLTVFLMDPYALKSAGGTVASSYSRIVRKSISRCCVIANNRRNSTSESIGSFFRISNDNVFFMLAKVKTVVFFCGSQSSAYSCAFN